jgi:hypothetical protein
LPRLAKPQKRNFSGYPPHCKLLDTQRPQIGRARSHRRDFSRHVVQAGPAGVTRPLLNVLSTHKRTGSYLPEGLAFREAQVAPCDFIGALLSNSVVQAYHNPYIIQAHTVACRRKDSSRIER